MGYFYLVILKIIPLKTKLQLYNRLPRLNLNQQTYIALTRLTRTLSSLPNLTVFYRNGFKYKLLLTIQLFLFSVLREIKLAPIVFINEVLLNEFSTKFCKNVFQLPTVSLYTVFNLTI